MDRDTAADVLHRLHREQNAFYAGNDETGLRALLTEGIDWHVPGSNLIAGDYHGIEDVFAYFTRRRSLANNTMRMQSSELLVGADEHVASLTNGTATVGGVEHSWCTVGLYRIVDGRIAECWLLPLDPVAFDLAWSAAE